MFNLLIISPGGKQKIERITKSGDYFDTDSVIWDERTDGPMPNVTLGKMERSGNSLVVLPDYLPAHAAALAEEQTEEEEQQRLDGLASELKNNATILQLRGMTNDELDAWFDVNASALPGIKDLLKLCIKNFIINNKE